LAREMHDTIIQGCVGVSTLLEAASGLGQSDACKMREFLDQARIQVRLTLDEARQAVWDLRHSELEGEISGMLREFVRSLSTETGVPITVETAGSPAPLEGGTLRSMFLVAREAVRNAVTHASAHQIGIRLRFDTDEIRLEVIDDGRGFTPPAAGIPVGGHYGIVGMRERIEQLGGRFVLRSSPGTGTAVIARLPLGGRRLQPESGSPKARN
jgi:signal transduction histidine kinase